MWGFLLLHIYMNESSETSLHGHCQEYGISHKTLLRFLSLAYDIWGHGVNIQWLVQTELVQIGDIF